MKRIVDVLLSAALIVITQSAWSMVRDRYEWMPRPEIESPFPADSEGGSNLPLLDTYANQHKR